jgi:SsrA-binding protein
MLENNVQTWALTEIGCSVQLGEMAKSKKKKPDDAKKSAPGAGGQERHISENRRAGFKFEILEQIECGMVLLGSEVKSLRENRVSLDEAYVRVRDGELWLVGADIAEYRQATIWNHSPRRPRKLLVKKRQLEKLSVRSHEKGLTLIPLRLYFNERGIVKLMVGVCKGKKLHDKRESLKTADAKRSMDRAVRRK